MTVRALSLVMIIAASFPTVVTAKDTGVTFGGPEAVPNRIAEDKKDRELPLKEQLAQNGIDLAIDYSVLSMKLSDTLAGADDTGSGGMVRFYGSWEALKSESGSTGSLIWKVEHRHHYGDTGPNFSPFNAGIVGLQAPPFSDQGGRLTNLYWKQRFNGGKSTVLAGFLDVTDYVDVHAAASPWTGFVNFAFSTGNSTLALPGDAALGVAAATMLTDNFFVIGGITDMESDPTKPFEGFDSFLNDGHYFKSLEFGWTSAQDAIYMDNIHITLWNSDKSDTLNQNEDTGVNISASKQYGKWLPFARAGWSENGSLLGIDKSLSTGFSYYGLGKETNNLGMAINWADANADDKQITLEAFYLMKLLPFWELTPDIQLVQNPALNPTDDQVLIVGLRTRLVW